MLEQGVFQILGCEFIRNQYQGELHTPGAVDQNNKTKSGRPDAYIIKPDGQYILCEFTTKDNSNATDFYNKLKDDLLGCLDPSVLGIDIARVDEIVLCCNSSISIQDMEKLNALKPDHIKLRPVGLNALAVYFSSIGKIFARDLLQIPYDTGQILTKAQFLETYQIGKMATPLDNQLFGREEELKELSEILGQSRVVVVNGPAGTGKSRLIMQVMDEFIAGDPDYTAYYIFEKSGAIIDDLLSYLPAGKKYILLIDDANRQLNNLVQVLEHALYNNAEIKILVTVRDYARTEVYKVLEKITFTPYYLGQLDRNYIYQIISSEPYTVINAHAQQRIIEVANGNPRLAIMAAMVFNRSKTINTLADISNIYDEYFGPIVSEKHFKEDKNIIKVLGLLAFFNNLDVEDERDLAILESFEISSEQFFSIAKQLEEWELVDIHQGTAVKVTDQIFATYCFYLSFFKLKTLSFKHLLTHYFASHFYRFRDSFTPLISAFGEDNILNAQKTMLIEFIDVVEDGTVAFRFFEIFGSFLPDQLFVYVGKAIHGTFNTSPSVFATLNNSNPILVLLAPFLKSHNERFIQALFFVIQYSKNQPDVAEQASKVLRNTLSLTQEDLETHFTRQKAAMTWFMERDNFRDKPDIFFQVFTNVMLADYNQQPFYVFDHDRFALHEYFKEVRGNYWKLVIENYNRYPEILYDELLTYSNTGNPINQLKVFDKRFVIKFLRKNLDRNKFKDCFLAHRLVKFISLKGSHNTVLKKVAAYFNHPTYEIYAIISFSNLSRYDFKGTYSEFELQRRNYLKDKLPLSSLEDFVTHYQHIQILIDFSLETKSKVSDGVLYLISICFENDVDLGFAVLEYYLMEGNKAGISPYQLYFQIGSNDMECCERLFNMLNLSTYEDKQRWLELYFDFIPEAYLKLNTVDDFLICYESNTSNHIHVYFDNFHKFDKIKLDTTFKLLEILFNKHLVNKDFSFQLDQPFFSKYLNYPENHLVFCQQLYLQLDEMDVHHDVYCEDLLALLNFDPSFLPQYINSYFTNTNRNTFSRNHKVFGKLWELNNAGDLIYEGINSLKTSITHSFYIRESNVFFQGISEEHKPQAYQWIEHMADSHPNDDGLLNLLLGVVRNQFRPHYESFLTRVLKIAVSMSVFTKLEFYNNSFSSNGDAIWEDFKASELRKVYGLINQLPNAYEYYEQKERLTRSIAYNEKWADYERKLKFRGLR